MNPTELPQEFANLKWGTRMPVPVRLGSGIATFRARGVCAVTIGDPQRLAEQQGDWDGLQSQIKNTIAIRFADVLAEQSFGKSSPAEVEALRDDMGAALKTAVEQSLGALGVTVTQLKVEAIEKT